MTKLVVFSGAGMSAESGIRTFRDSNGLWENYDIQQVATPEAWERNPALVQRFYNEHRKNILEAQPNEAHQYIAKLQDHYDVQVITQNIDDLHERWKPKCLTSTWQYSTSEKFWARCTIYNSIL